MTAVDPLSLAVEAAVERAVERKLERFRADLPGLLSDAVAQMRSEPLLPGHLHAGCTAAAWGMRLARNPALAAALAVVGMRDGRTTRYRRSDFDRVFSSTCAKPSRKADPSKAREAKRVQAEVRGGLRPVNGGRG